MRTLTALALALVAATAGPAAAAPARPSGVTFTDPAGDANGLDGAHGAGSQPAFDVLKVRLSPHAPTRHESGVTVRIDLAAAPPTTPGTSYFFRTEQHGCETRVTYTVGTDRPERSILTTCGTSGGFSFSSLVDPLRVSGSSVTFVVPADALTDATRGAGLKGIEVGTAVGDPMFAASPPAPVDRATYAKVYRVGS